MKEFERVPDVGTLHLEKVLFEFDKIPMITVCKDDGGKRYLCLCTDVIIQETWMITQMTNAILIDLIKDKISILEAYRVSKHPVIIGVRECGQMIYTVYTFDELPEDELPDENEKLENPNLESYLQMLYQREAVEREKQIVSFKAVYCASEQYSISDNQRKKFSIVVNSKKQPFKNSVWDKACCRMHLLEKTSLGKKQKINSFLNYNFEKTLGWEMQLLK